MKELLLITGSPAPFRIKWCEELSKYYDVQIIYTKMEDSECNTNWLKKDSDKCDIRYYKISDLLLKMDLFKILDTYKKSIIIFDGYGILVNFIGINYLKIFGRKNFFVNIDGWQCGVNEKIIIKMIKRILFMGKYYFLVSGIPTKENLIQYGIQKNRIFVHNLSPMYSNEQLSQIITESDKHKLRDRLGIKESKVVLCVSRFIELKRIEDLLYCKKNLDDNVAIIIIGGQKTEKYKRIINENNLKGIYFLDFMKFDELKIYYMLSDVFVLPSRTEVWGLVINEAMSFGLPVIATTNCVAAKSLVKNGWNGYIIEPFDINSLANQINKLLSDNDTLTKMSVRSLEIAKKYTIENMIAKHKMIFDNYLKETNNEIGI